jgi:hypothetical protein
VIRNRLVRFFANDVSAYNPTLWAYEGISLLWENLGMARSVNNDFSSMIATYGDVVKTRKVTKFTANRKDPSDNVTVQDAVATNYQVTLNQWPHVSFRLNDAEIAKSFKDLVAEFLEPAMMTLATFVDRALVAQFAQFLPNSVGRLGNMTTSTVKGDMIDARRALNDLLVPDRNRLMYWTSRGESLAINTDIFLAANQRGDGGSALTTGALGNVLGFQNFMSQNCPTVPSTTKVTGTINQAGGYAVGTKVFTVTGFSAAIAAGSFITIAGDDTPLRVVSTVGGATPNQITVSTGTKRTVANSAVVTVYTPGTVSAAYAAGYTKALTISAPIMPSVGQMVAFGTDATGPIYVVVGVTSTTVTLDRPLDASVSSGAAINLGPAGDFNFAFDRDAIMMVSRPLPSPMPGTGASAFVANNESIALRATITYDGNAQAHLITLDTLFGIAVRDSSRLVPVFG